MNNNPFSLKDKTILVTGASSGIGQSVAIECSKMGANVVITGRDIERLNHCKSITSGGVIQADITKPEQIETLLETCPELDGMVFSAGINDKVLMNRVNKQKIDKIFDTNLFGPMLITQGLLKRRKIKKSASIVYISSISTDYATISNSLYAASKGALESFMRVAALELANRSIRVNGVRPGMIETPILEAYKLQEELDTFKRNIPLGRFGKPEEIAYACLYFLSDAAKYITGTLLTIDGGTTLR
ncbi:SDR family NAD(P)-dependent oxidoreductase [Parabacteroides distasonis]|uniref:SDR family NAD(P)-dependent oxidoreductase n=1 Tax=Parabacteroides distasonis TaxID=823 RepID=UPI00189D028D|nr:SDR family oxidoreductase [Parabacteroides distasonis]MDB9152999.1 SDR family NAD(P)-dependent oxidoreductase [Parabacteroides distasonis]MDB9157676.1 SDR family NAD(P)-dependent oxidoreductase [Parabacteroides distasonis]MDB9166541.1 SDR family NAD(P)-dependent oxidoreductase [Parabacteroides distasonis]MDB9170960.1 SDR family NAD(P)-dependent oxidoreductase [Parabacteroides distasonis]MDB9192726.1 SDR family NAD(P)-dependent oxidoreductase [Parabacteroides distasonis]